MVERFICQTGSPAGTWDSTTDAVSASTIMSCSIGILTHSFVYIFYFFFFLKITAGLHLQLLEPTRRMVEVAQVA